MFIIVDQNEGIDRNRIKGGIKEKKTLANSRAMARLKGYFGEIEFAELACGDINIILDDGKLLAIERKRPNDFLGGIASGRIFRQVENMAKNAAWSCILLEGIFSFDKEDMAVVPVYSPDDGKIIRWEKTEWKGASVRGAMYAIQWSGCPIIMVDPVTLPKVVHDIALFCSKPAEHAQSLGRKRIVSFPPISLPEEIVSALPGVGLKRARALLEFAQRKNANQERVPSLGEALSWASMLNMIDKKSRPEGWGAKTILNVRVALGLEMGEYLTVHEDKRQVAERKELERKSNEQSKRSKTTKKK
ncbi:MAG: ERCC4 domain-containing protein [Casimicrobiaceae bacterium]